MRHQHCYRLFLVSCLLVLLFPILEGSAKLPPTTQFIDLEFSSFERGETIPLHGKIEFYWAKQLTADEFDGSSHPSEGIVAPFPASWTEYRIDGKPLPSYGIGTYRLGLVIQGVSRSRKSIALMLPEINSSFKLWVNDELLAQHGEVSNNPYKAKGNPSLSIVRISERILKQSHDTLMMVMQVSNFDSQEGGIVKEMRIGYVNHIYDLLNHRIFFTYLVLGMLLLITLQGIIMPIRKQNRYSKFWLAAFRIALMLVILTCGFRVLLQLIPRMSWSIFMGLHHIALLWLGCLMMLFCRYVYPEVFRNVVILPFIIVGLILSLLYLILPVHVFTIFHTLESIFIYISFSALVFWLLPVCIYKRLRASWFAWLAVASVFAGVALTQVLNLNGRESDLSWILVCTLIYCLLGSYVAISRSIHLERNSEEDKIEIDQATRRLKHELIAQQELYDRQKAALAEHKRLEGQKNWADTGITEITRKLSAHKQHFDDLCQCAILNTAKYMKAQVAALYIAQFNSQSFEWELHLMGDYGLTEKQRKENAILPSTRGLTGACFVDNQFSVISDLPEDFLQISSGLGHSNSPSILLMPLQSDSGVIGVLELGRFEPFLKYEISFMGRLCAILANEIMHTKTNEENIKELNELREKQRNMGAYEENLQLRIEQLEAEIEEYQRPPSAR